MPPFLSQAMIDQGINTKSLNVISLILLAQLFFFMATLSIDYVRSWILLHINSRIDIALIADFRKHPKIAVLPLHKKPLYDWIHIRVLCYLQFMGSSLINSSSSMSSKGFANTCLNHTLGSIFVSLQHAMNV